ncbi:unnamed protein product (macronuclear) [Paramecium tetraurelia]|uniref:Cyclic nucleotide-binding domain-containing protein n=1 Tax=Paramecium tetraurelia TaxID=5888 RepID=A0D0R0_PARTE|nr:uncharacterized protein GSPATT00012179001 [Paramecium tetraurelia]CAK76627.1 unnamed protein product [Paramecium tetraurelia]|eukprot:XP_001444024.1 hypothetical protein (macronuclear) [Paramecium tetraurelia strain d4-2]
MQQENEPTSLSISRRAAYNYIKPILHEDSLVQTPTTSFRSHIKQNHQKHSIFQSQPITNDIIFNQFPLQDSFEDVRKCQSCKFIAVNEIAVILNSTLHSIISIQVLLLQFFHQTEQLVLLRIIGIIFSFIHLILCLLLKQSSLDTSQLATLIFYVVSFIFENQILIIYLFISIFHIQTILNVIKVSIIIVTKQYGFTQFLLLEIVILIYTLHLYANFYIIFMQESVDNYEFWFIYLKAINQSLQILLFNIQMYEESTTNQLANTFFIIFNINYYFLLLKRYENHKKSYFLHDQFQIFIINRCVQFNISLLEMFNLLWILLKIQYKDQFLQKLENYKIQVYVDQLKKCKIIEIIFSEDFIRNLAYKAKIINAYKNEIVTHPGLYIVIQGGMKVQIQAEYETKQILKNGDYFGLIEMILNKSQNLFLKSIKEESLLIYISGDDFHHKIKEFTEDYEKMRFIHDQLLFSSSTTKIKQKCYFCQQYHVPSQCKIINFKPEFDFEKLKLDEQNDRRYFQRANKKHIFQIRNNSESSKSSNEFEESFEIDPVSSEMQNERQIGKNILGSISQMIVCNSKISQEGFPQLLQTQSFKVQESQTQQNQVNTTQGWRVLDLDNRNICIDNLRNFQFYDPVYNIETIIRKVNKFLEH